jgi:hypothetical protein
MLFLADGRILVEEARPSDLHPRLWVFDAVGKKLSGFELPLPAWNPQIGPEVAPGHVAVTSFHGAFTSEDAVVVDVASGAVIDTLSGLRPAFDFPVGSAAAPSSVHFFRAAEGRVADHPEGVSRLIRIDFKTGERSVVAGFGAQKSERITAR